MRQISCNEEKCLNRINVILPKILRRPDYTGEIPIIRFECVSKFNPELIINQNNWVVTHLNVPKKHPGHAMIIVERIDIQKSDNLTINPTFKIGYYDLSLPKNASIFSSEAHVQIQEFDHYHYLYENNKNPRSYLRTREEVLKMLGGIQEQFGNTVPFHFAGSKTYLYPLNQKHNCLTWSEEMLELANIEMNPSITEYIKAKPDCYFL